jgi:hypothetical protein
MKPFGLMVLGATLALAGCASAVPPFKGNETGGIIAWSPEAQAYRHQIAGEYCAQYGRLHRITSVARRYGDYIGFECYWPRGYEPGGAVVRSRY